MTPLLPDPDDAREWARRELADPVYAAAEPTPLDRAARAVADFFGRLLDPDLSGGWGPAVAVIAGAVVGALVIAAVLIWGRPRRSARGRAHGTAALFGEAEGRTAAQLRADADAARARGEWDEAIVLRFRALARALAERAVLEPSPGITAQRFAREAARAFPGQAVALADAAAVFDDVRYLRRPGTAALADRVAQLDAALASDRPVFAEALA